jgi:hypothetical protein
MIRLILLAVAACTLVACETPTDTRLPGGVTIRKVGMLGGKRTILYRNGDVLYVDRSDYEKSYGDTMEAGTTLGTGMIMGNVAKAADAADAAVARSGQREATRRAGIAAGLEAERIKAGLETTRILNPAVQKLAARLDRDRSRLFRKRPAAISRRAG